MLHRFCGEVGGGLEGGDPHGRGSEGEDLVVVEEEGGGGGVGGEVEELFSFSDVRQVMAMVRKVAVTYHRIRLWRFLPCLNQLPYLPHAEQTAQALELDDVAFVLPDGRYW